MNKDENSITLRQDSDFVANVIKYGGRPASQTDIDKNYVIVDDKGNFKLKLTKRNRLKASNKLFLIMILSKLSKNGVENYYDKPLTLGLKEYSTYRNITTDKARSKLKDDMSTLYDMSVELKILSKNKKEIIGSVDFRILSAKATIKMNQVYIWFTDKFLDFYKRVKTIMPLPKEIFMVRVKDNPNTFDMFMKLLMHYNINNNKNNKNKNVLSVNTLLEYCSAIPRYDKDIKKNGGMTQRIIKPFIRDLNAINIIEWYFLDNQNNFKTPNDIKNYYDFIDLKVVWSWKKEIFNELTA